MNSVPNTEGKPLVPGWAEAMLPESRGPFIKGMICLAIVLLAGLLMIVFPAASAWLWVLQVVSGIALLALMLASAKRRAKNVGLEQTSKTQSKTLAHQTRALKVLYDLAASINIANNADELLERFLHTLKDLFAAQAACARLVEPNGQMRMVASIGLDPEVAKREAMVPVERCLCGKAVLTNSLCRQVDLGVCAAIVGIPFFEDKNIQMLAVPLQYRDRTLGVYNLFVEADPRHENPDLTELLISIGRHLGVAIEKANLDKQELQLSRMKERTHLANELHDSLAQTLASLRMQVRVLDETLHEGDEPAVWQVLERVEGSMDVAYAELRDLIGHFRAPMDERGLIHAIEKTISKFRQETGVSIIFQNGWKEVDLEVEKELDVLRIVQEALANIRKHAKANTVRVLLRKNGDNTVMALIEDDGVGLLETENADSDHPGEHIGLSVMRERAESLGGELTIETELGEGTRVMLEMPQATSHNKVLFEESI